MTSRSQFVTRGSRGATGRYKLSQTLGRGSFGAVVKAKDTITGSTRAWKTVSKKKEGEALPREEARVTSSLDHPSICRLFEVIEDSSNFYFVLELCEGGDLMHHLDTLTEVYVEEATARGILRQLFSATDYLHQRLIAHADFAARNVLLMKRGQLQGNTVKLADFGSAKHFRQEQEAGPHKGDVWGLGLLMRGLLCDIQRLLGGTSAASQVSTGSEPSQLRRHASSTQKRGDFDAAAWSHVSGDARCLCGRLLRRNPIARWTAEEALHHTWFGRSWTEDRSEKLPADLLSRIWEFAGSSSLRQAALQMAGDQLSSSDATFLLLDADGDGLLTPADISDSLKEAGIPVPALPELTGLLRRIDPDGLGAIEFSIFNAMLLSPSTLDRSVLWAAFQTLDRDADGRISPSDVKNVLSALSEVEVTTLISAADCNEDGVLDFDEFSGLVQGKVSSDIAGSGQHSVNSQAITRRAKFHALGEKTFRTVDDDDDADGASCAPSSCSDSHYQSDESDEDEDGGDLDWDSDDSEEEEKPKLDILGNPIRAPQPRQRPTQQEALQAMPQQPPQISLKPKSPQQALSTSSSDTEEIEAYEVKLESAEPKHEVPERFRRIIVSL
eukprot:TRINITY_DN109052_c0_g1_i1.p1 TRINITY_DN109052_c0_g1~~TRINITY_DN109052_c0_g1_i1.p1  ORF type:complete len:612 (+),score=128.91 TRINITY_DN109052_c0_g1_i1:35-1870(+)